MKLSTLILTFLLPLFSFGQKLLVESQEIYYFKNEVSCWYSNFIQPVYATYNIEVKDSVYMINIKYKNSDRTSEKEYILSTKENFNHQYFYINSEKKEEVKFKEVDHKNYLLNNEPYVVYKFASGYESIDGCINHFWCPKFGIIMTRSWTWCNYSRLMLNDPKTQLILDRLIEFLIMDYKFYSGCDEHRVLVPKDEYEEFLKYKYSNDTLNINHDLFNEDE